MVLFISRVVLCPGGCAAPPTALSSVMQLPWGRHHHSSRGTLLLGLCFSLDLISLLPLAREPYFHLLFSSLRHPRGQVCPFLLLVIFLKLISVVFLVPDSARHPLKLDFPHRCHLAAPLLPGPFTVLVKVNTLHFKLLAFLFL